MNITLFNGTFDTLSPYAIKGIAYTQADMIKLCTEQLNNSLFNMAIMVLIVHWFITPILRFVSKHIMNKKSQTNTTREIAKGIYVYSPGLDYFIVYVLVLFLIYFLKF